MGVITKTKTWIDNDTVDYTDINANFDSLYDEFNGNIDNSNIKSGAAIVESKIAFSSGGHGHTGGTDGKLIQVNRGFGFFSGGDQAVANDLSWNPTVPEAMTAIKIWAHAKVAPTGADLICRVYNITQAKVVASITIAATTTDANSTTIANAALTTGDALRMDTTQVGSTLAGTDVSINIECTQP